MNEWTAQRLVSNILGWWITRDEQTENSSFESLPIASFDTGVSGTQKVVACWSQKKRTKYRGLKKLITHKFVIIHIMCTKTPILGPNSDKASWTQYVTIPNIFWCISWFSRSVLKRCSRIYQRNYGGIIFTGGTHYFYERTVITLRYIFYQLHFHASR